MCRTVLILAVAWSVSIAASAGPVLYENGFEAPLYSVGDLAGQDGWSGAYSSSGTANNPTQIVEAGTMLPLSVAAGHGQVLYNYRPFGSQLHRVYRDVAPTPVDQGTVVLSYDALRTGTADNTAWFFVNNGTAEDNYLAYWGLNNNTGAGFTIYPGYATFGSISMNEWYNVELHFRLSGAGEETYDLIARNTAGDIVGSKLDISFATTGVPLGKFHVRTFDDGSGTLVDNLKLARPVDKVRHGSFDAYQTGNLLGQAGWTQGGALTTPSVTVAPDAQGQGKHLSVKPSGANAAYTNAWVGTYQDLLDTDYLVEDPATIVYTVEAAWTGSPTYADTWGWFSIGDNTLTWSNPADASTIMGSAANFGFRNHSSGSIPKAFFVNDGNGNTTLGPFRFSAAEFADDTWYRFESLIYPESNEWDLLVYNRDTDELVWDSFADLGSHLGFGTDDVDLTRIAVYARDTTGTLLVDNLSVTGVPEPAATVLLALGLASLLMRRRRR